MGNTCGKCKHWTRLKLNDGVCGHPRLTNYSDVLPFAATVFVVHTTPFDAEDECEFWEKRQDSREYEAEVER